MPVFFCCPWRCAVTRTERLGLVLTPSEKEAVRCLAEAEGGLSQAATVRRLIRQEAQRRGMWGPANKLQAQTAR
jgi:hypothetical protein